MKSRWPVALALLIAVPYCILFYWLGLDNLRTLLDPPSLAILSFSGVLAFGVVGIWKRNRSSDWKLIELALVGFLVLAADVITLHEVLPVRVSHLPARTVYPRPMNLESVARSAFAGGMRDFLLDPKKPFAERAYSLNTLLYEGAEGLAEARVVLERLKSSTGSDEGELARRLEAQLNDKPRYRYDRMARKGEPVCRDKDGGKGLNPGDLDKFKRSKRGDCDDLSGADLSGIDLSGAWLPGARLRGAKFRSSKFPQARLTSADLRDADFTDADLRQAQLAFADLTGADLSNALINDRTALPISYDEAIRQGATFVANPETAAAH